MSRRISAFEKRIHEVDFIRGLMMLLVIMDHVFWSLKAYGKVWYDGTGIEFFNVQYQIFNFYWISASRTIIRQIVLFGFVFVSGISCGFSKNNWKRAGIMLLVAFVLAIVTNILQAEMGNDTQVYTMEFNVIAVLAWSCLIYCFVQNRSWKAIVATGLIGLLITTTVIPSLQALPHSANAYVPSLWLPKKAEADWMPLFPYFCYFFGGAALTRFLYPNKQSLFTRHEFERPFCFVGRHAIWVYLGHEPLLVIICLVLNAIILGA